MKIKFADDSEMFLGIGEIASYARRESRAANQAPSGVLYPSAASYPLLDISGQVPEITESKLLEYNSNVLTNRGQVVTITMEPGEMFGGETYTGILEIENFQRLGAGVWTAKFKFKEIIE